MTPKFHWCIYLLLWTWIYFKIIWIYLSLNFYVFEKISKLITQNTHAQNRENRSYGQRWRVNVCATDRYRDAIPLVARTKRRKQKRIYKETHLTRGHRLFSFRFHLLCFCRIWNQTPERFCTTRSTSLTLFTGQSLFTGLLSRKPTVTYSPGHHVHQHVDPSEAATLLENHFFTIEYCSWLLIQ